MIRNVFYSYHLEANRKKSAGAAAAVVPFEDYLFRLNKRNKWKKKKKKYYYSTIFRNWYASETKVSINLDAHHSTHNAIM